MASAYQLVLKISIEHLFFGDGVARGIRIVPTVACSALLDRAGLLSRPFEGGIALYGDLAARERLAEHVKEAGGMQKMGFLVYSGDPHFAEYTLPPPRPGELLFFDTRCAGTDAGGRRQLHRQEHVDGRAMLALDHKRVLRLLGKQQLGRAPLMAVALAVTGALLALPPEAPGRHFHARFDAGASHWKYLLFGVLGEKAGEIADAGGQVRFERLGKLEVEPRREAAVFLSDRPIPLRERQVQRFALHEKAPNSEKVLIKRMPNASLGKRFPHQQDGGEVLVSEIFINQ
jgi:hypothetical protein